MAQKAPPKLSQTVCTYNRRNTTTLSFDIFLKNIMCEFGTSTPAIKKLFNLSDCGYVAGEKPVNVPQKAHQFQVRQTQGHELRRLGGDIAEFFREKLESVTIKSPLNASVPKRNAANPILSLKAWTTELFISAGQRAYFGDALATIDPGLPQALIELDDLSWQVFYQYPRPFRPKVNQLSAHIKRSLEMYLELPPEQRPARGWFTQALEQEYRQAGLGNKDIAAQMLFLYWGINTNVSKVAFWMLSHMLFSSHLLPLIQAEVDGAVTSDGYLQPDSLSHRCPQLHAVWLETLRLTSASTALRTLTADTWLSGTKLSRGRLLMMSARRVHFDTTAFGADATAFRSERFVENPKLQRSASFRPFGGGPTLCPGRYLARYMVLAFVALVLRRYDVRLARPQTFPRYQENRPTIGILSSEDDLEVELRERRDVSGREAA